MLSNKNGSNRTTSVGGRAMQWVRGLDSARANFDERALAVFQSDILASAQFLSTYKRRSHLNPERTLMLAILHDAVVCFQDYTTACDKRKRALFLEAEDWILDKDRKYLFSFVNVCESLGFDADYLRQGLMQWKAAALTNRNGRKYAN